MTAKNHAIRAVNKTVYMAPDGREFATREDAMAWSIRSEIENLLFPASVLQITKGEGRQYSSFRVAEAIYENWPTLRSLMDNIRDTESQS